MKTQHTPTPWRTGDTGLTIFGPPNGNPSPKTVATLNMMGPSRREDAAFIVRAVNSHRDMVQFVRDFLEGNVSDAELARRGHRIIAKAEGR